MESHWRSYIILIVTSFVLLSAETKAHKHSNDVVKVAGFVIYKKDADHGVKYLLLETKKHGQKWTPPKGRLEEKETELEGATRELKEETGITENDIKVDLDSKIFIKPPKSNHPKEITFWTACLHEDKPITLSGEHSQYKWLPLKEALELTADETTKEVLQHSADHLAKSHH